MIAISLSKQALLKEKAQAYALCVEEEFTLPKDIKTALSKTFPAIEEFIKKRSFTGQAKSSLAIPFNHEGSHCYLFLIGLGKSTKKKIDLEVYRRAVGTAVRLAQSHHITAMALDLPKATIFNIDAAQLIEQTTVIAYMADYHFDDFKKERPSQKKVEIILTGNTLTQQHGNAALNKGAIIAHAVNQTRHWVDTPPSRLTPTNLADYATKIAKENKLKITVFDEPEIIKMGMGGIAAVAAGSEQDAKLIIMEYRVSQSAPTLAFVGKGITFDSGGLSIKPAVSMETMKEDMAGAAAVINAIGALAKLKPKVNIIAVAPTSENLPSGTATKPGDVVYFYNGTSAEIKNTDAEGRLILADALSYTVKHYQPDFMIDVATLTGACDYAVGPFYAGLLSQHDHEANQVMKAAEVTGDLVWRLPMNNEYAAAIKSDVADICNSGSSRYKAGTITASFFLKHFVGETPWVHLDIASVAFDVPDTGYSGTGATGAGVRLLIELALRWK